MLFFKSYRIASGFCDKHRSCNTLLFVSATLLENNLLLQCLCPWLQYHCITRLIDRFVGQNLVQITQGRILERATEGLFCISIMAFVGCVWGDRLKAKRVRGIISGKSKAAECIFDVEPIVASAIVWGCESVCVCVCARCGCRACGC